MYKPGLAACVIAAVLGAACSREAAAPHTAGSAEGPALPGTPSPSARLPEGVDPLAYRLALEIVPSATEFSGHVHIDVALARPERALQLHAEGLRLSNVQLQSVTAPGQAETPRQATVRTLGASGLVALELAEPIGPGNIGLDIDFSGDFDRFLRGLYRIEHAGNTYAFTQFEATDARKAFPCFDEPRFKTPFDIVLTTPAGEVAIANTPIVSEKPLANGRTEVTFARTEKLPTYLVAFAVGPLDVVEGAPLPASAVRNHTLPFRAVAPRGRGKDLSFVLAETPKLVASLERYVGTPYPYAKLDLIAVPDFAAGAMENAGAITYRDTLLLVGASAPEWQRRASIGVNAHELAHQWFGDLVTMPWWDDLWLNEAFATWLGGRVVDEVHPEFEGALSRLAGVDRAMDTDSKENARQIRQPIQSEHDIKNAFDSITYTKGAAVLGMFERYLGAEAFQKGLRLYLERYRFGNASTPDLLKALEDGSGKPVAAAFSTFLDRPGLPHVGAELSCNPGAGARVRLRQTRYVPLGSKLSRTASWQVPVCVRYSAPGGPVREQCTLLDAAEGELALEGGCPAWVFPNAQASGYYRWSLDAAALQKLLGQGFGSLTPAERLSSLSNAEAAARAGEGSFEALMSVARRAAQDPERQIAGSALALLARVRDKLLSAAELPAYERLVHGLIARRTQEVGLFPRGAEDSERKLLRPELVSTLAFEANDRALRTELERLGRARLGLGEDARAARLPYELIDAAFDVAVQNGGAAVIERVKSLLPSATDGLERGRLLGALGANRDPALTPNVLELTLAAGLRTNERAGPIFGQIGESATREAAYRWVTEHFDALVEQLGKDNASVLVSIAGAFCSREHAERARQFYAPRVEQLSGGPRNLRLALESVELCAAFAEAHQKSAREYFARAPSE